LSVIPAVAHGSPLPVLPISDDWSVMVPTIRAMVLRGNATKVCLVGLFDALERSSTLLSGSQEGPSDITRPAAWPVPG
jgi:hypothetical protein